MQFETTAVIGGRGDCVGLADNPEDSSWVVAEGALLYVYEYQENSI